MKPSNLLFLLALPLGASVIQTSGVINLTGFGGLSNPNYDGWGLGLWLSASGSNGVDTVSVRTLTPSPALPQMDMQDYYLSNLVFDEGAGGCMTGFYVVEPDCTATIDGISGYAAFSNLGGGYGLVQVYEYPLLAQEAYPGPLLAEAQVYSLSQVTGVTYSMGLQWCPTCPPFPQCVYYCPPDQGRFEASFTLYGNAPADPPASQTAAPEPGTLALGLIGLAALGWLRAGGK